MKIVFCGGFTRGLHLLERLIERGETIVTAFLYPEDPHEEVQVVERLAEVCRHHNIPAQVTRHISSQALQSVTDLSPDVLFCLGWRSLFPPALFSVPQLGAVAAHDSLLPRLRGFAPTNWGLLLGHDRLGVTLFQMSEAMDSGDVYFQESYAVGPEMTFAEASAEVTRISVNLFERYLDQARAGTLQTHPQDSGQATYGCARTVGDGLLDWNWPTTRILRTIRAIAPPGPAALTTYEGRMLRVIAAHEVDDPQFFEGRVPGRVVKRDTAAGTVDVLAADTIVRIDRVQLADEAIRPAAEVITSVRHTLGGTSGLDLVRMQITIEELRDRLATLESRLAALGSRQAP